MEQQPQEPEAQNNIQYWKFDNQAEFDELSIVAIGTHIESLEYGQLTTHSIDAFGGTGLGTYGASLSGSDIIVKYTPNSGVTTTYVNALSIGISSESYVGVGTQGYTHGNLIAQGVGIASSSSPSAVQIGHYGRSTATGVDGAYGILVVSDTTNNITQMSEFVIADDDTDIYLTEYGVVDSEVELVHQDLELWVLLDLMRQDLTLLQMQI